MTCSANAIRKTLAAKARRNFSLPGRCANSWHNSPVSLCQKREKIDPTFGSGRMVLASAEVYGPYQEYYGIDIEETCVKMTAINFFLSDLFHSEVLRADALWPEDFRVSYKISFLPYGMFRIMDDERWPLWHLQLDFWEKQPVKAKQEPPEFVGNLVQSCWNYNGRKPYCD